MGEKLVAFVFVVKNCKSIIDVSIIHQSFVDSFEKQSFIMLARDGPRGEPIAMPSICRCIILLKLNSTEEVAVCISSTKTAQGMCLYRSDSLHLFTLFLTDSLEKCQTKSFENEYSTFCN